MLKPATALRRVPERAALLLKVISSSEGGNWLSMNKGLSYNAS
jgi:hypothetical protein